MNMKILRKTLLLLLLLSPHIAGAEDGKLDFLVFVGADYLERNADRGQLMEDSDFTPSIDLLLTYNNGPLAPSGGVFRDRR